MDKTKMVLYERMRKEIDTLKIKDGFECHKCGSCCYGPKNPISRLDIEFMKEKGVDLNGIEIEGSNYYIRRNLKIIDDHCYYLDDKFNSCTIHPYNPMLCSTYPFVVNINSSTLVFKLCLREQSIRKNLVTDDLRILINDLFNMEYEEGSGEQLGY